MAAEIRGIVPVLSTPFKEDLSLDEESLRRLIDYCIDDAKVHGISGPGGAGEGDRMSEDELERVIDIMVDQAAGKVPVVTGLVCSSLASNVSLARYSEEAGVNAVFTRLGPSRFQPDKYDFYATMAQAVDIPIMVYDVNSFYVPNEVIFRLNRDYPQVRYVKAETSPGGAKISEMIEVGGDDLVVLSAQGACQIIDDLRRGVEGNMPGCHVLKHSVRVWDLWHEGDYATARGEHNRFAPLKLYRQLPGWGVAVVKEILKRHGIFETALSRPPAGIVPDERDLDELWVMLDFIGYDEF